MDLYVSYSVTIYKYYSDDRSALQQPFTCETHNWTGACVWVLCLRAADQHGQSCLPANARQTFSPLRQKASLLCPRNADKCTPLPRLLLLNTDVPLADIVSLSTTLAWAVSSCGPRRHAARKSKTTQCVRCETCPRVELHIPFRTTYTELPGTYAFV